MLEDTIAFIALPFIAGKKQAHSLFVRSPKKFNVSCWSKGKTCELLSVGHGGYEVVFKKTSEEGYLIKSMQQDTCPDKNNQIRESSHCVNSVNMKNSL